MIKFQIVGTEVEFEYQGELSTNNKWAWNSLQAQGKVQISRVFEFQLDDLINPPTTTEDFDDYVYRFRFGSIIDDYIHVRARILKIKNDLIISRDIKLERSIFVAERHISIFGRLSKLLKHTDPIIIGGTHAEAVPLEVFEELLRKFPNSYELNRYADARVQTLLSQYLDGMKDARGRYEKYLDKKK